MIQRAYYHLCIIVGHAAIMVAAIITMSLIYATFEP